MKHEIPEGSSVVVVILATLFLIVLALLVLASTAHAGPPALPFSPYGTVTSSNDSTSAALAGTTIAASCGGVVYRATTVQIWEGQAWYYNLDVPADDPETSGVLEGCQPGQIVYFLVGGVVVEQTAVWVSGSSPRIDLTVPPEWDKSSLTLTGQCIPNGSAEFTVTNSGASMAGTSPWREYENSILTHSGDLQLAAGKSNIFTFVPLTRGVPIEFQVDQRPGHPGGSHPKVVLNCTPSAIALRTFTARSLGDLFGNRGGCGRKDHNMRYGIICNVSDAGHGFVSGDCTGGYWFSRVVTSRTFAVGQVVTVNGCEGINQELYAPIRISR